MKDFSSITMLYSTLVVRYVSCSATSVRWTVWLREWQHRKFYQRSLQLQDPSDLVISAPALINLTVSSRAQSLRA
jgi:hypothetical protein